MQDFKKKFVFDSSELTKKKLYLIIPFMAGTSFFQDLFSSLFGGGSDDALKHSMLKRTAKALSKTKFRFYKYSSGEIDPSFAKFFYDIYAAVSPMQVMFASMPPNALKRMVIDASLSDGEKKLIDEFTEDAILKNGSSVPLDKLAAQLKEKFGKLNESFGGDKMMKADALYTNLEMMKNFSQFDFFFLLKKFDPSLRERNFETPPRFRVIKGVGVQEDIKNFMAVAWPVLSVPDWDELFKLVKSAKGVEPISPSVWKKLISRMRQLRDQRVLEMMLQLISENPGYKEIIKPEELHIMSDYFGQIKKNMETSLESLKEKQTEDKVNSLVMQVFGKSSVEPLENYNTKSSEPFEKKGLMGFIYADPLSYMKHFLIDFVKKDVRELSDILVVRGKWVNSNLPKPMSEAAHQLMGYTTRIAALDEKLAEGGEFGRKLKTYLPRVGKDRDAGNISRTVMRDANNEAAHILLSARQEMVVFAKNLKLALEDCVKTHSELVLNWQELNNYAEGKLKQRCVDVYKKLYAFISLLQNFNIKIIEHN